MPDIAKWSKDAASSIAQRPRTLVHRMIMTGDGPDGGSKADTKKPMSGRVLIALVAWLHLVGLVGTWLAWTIWVARPASPIEAEWPAPSEEALADGAAPVIDDVQPDTLVYGLDLPALRVFGRGFSESSDVLLDGALATSAFIPPHQIRVTLNDADFRQSATIAVTVTNDSGSSAPARVRIESESSAFVEWRPLILPSVEITVETRLLLLVVLLGGLGGTLASFNSLSSYRGEGKLTKSWFLHYWFSPLLGGGVSLFMYMVVRAGFLSGTNVRVDSGVTPWGLVAVSGLVGLFYDKALLKLREVFIAIFSPRDDRSGKLVPEDGVDDAAGLTIETRLLEPATVGQRYHQTLEAKGGEEPYSWSVRPDLPGGLLLDPMTGLVSGEPTEAKAAAPYEFTVSDMKRVTVAISLELEVRAR
jgi:hypothetical protein